MEEFYISVFGYHLYKVFFKQYTEKLWGTPVNSISSDWGKQRIRTVSFKDIISPNKAKQKKSVSTVYDYFWYPKNGSGDMWCELAKKVLKMGLKVNLNTEVISLDNSNNHVSSIQYIKNNSICREKFDYVVSSMPLKKLICSMKCPDYVRTLAYELMYRDMIVVAFTVSFQNCGALYLKVEGDNWIYVQDKSIVFGRIQILNNWSIDLVSDVNNILVEVEIFCQRSDKIWNISDEEIVELVMYDLEKIDFIKQKETVNETLIKRILDAYPIYTSGYSHIEKIEEWINQFDNLLSVGRNGQHRYNNMDHSVKCGMIAADIIMKGKYDKKAIWSVNKEQEYIERNE